MSDDLPFVPDATLDLVDAGWWLELRCECERSTSIPHKLLARAHGAAARVPNLLARMRCATCGRRPIRAEWIVQPRGRRERLRLPAQEARAAAFARAAALKAPHNRATPLRCVA